MIDGQYTLFQDDSVLRLSPDEKDKVFRRHGESKQRIYEQIMKREGTKADAAFLKKEYGIGGKSFDLENRPPMFIDYDAKGIKVQCFKEGKSILFNWEEAAKYIEMLVITGRY